MRNVKPTYRDDVTLSESVISSRAFSVMKWVDLMEAWNAGGVKRNSLCLLMNPLVYVVLFLLRIGFHGESRGICYLITTLVVNTLKMLKLQTVGQ